MSAPDLKKYLIQALAAAEEGDYVGALDCVQNGISEAGENSATYHMMGLIALRMGEMPKALELFRKAHQMSPDLMEHAEALSILYARTGRISDSLYFGKLSTVLTPSAYKDALLPEWLGTFEASFAEAEDSPYFERGMKALHQGQLRQALSDFQHEAELNPKRGDAWRMLAKVLRLQKRPVEEVLILRGLEDAGNMQAWDFARIGHALNVVSRCDDAKAAYEAAREMAGHDADIEALRVADLYMRPDIGIEEIQDQERSWGRLFNSQTDPDRKPGQLSSGADGRISVGLFSSRFRLGEGLDYVWPLLLHPKYGRLRISCYSYNEYDDAMTRRIAGCVTDFQDFRDVNEPTAARIIQNDGIQVLIDLDSVYGLHHSALVLGRPAPVVLRYNGIADTVQALGYDAVFGGGSSYDGSSKNTCLVNGGFFCFPEGGDDAQQTMPPSERMMRVGWMPSLTAISDYSLKILKEITTRRPDITIVIHTSSIGGAHGANEIQSRLTQFGLRPFVEFSEVVDDHTAARETLFRNIDIVLDMADADPDNVLAALIGGRPVLSLPGNLPAGHVGADLVRAAGGAEMVCSDREDLVTRIERLHDDREAWQQVQHDVNSGVGAARNADARQARFDAFEAAILQLVD